MPTVTHHEGVDKSLCILIKAKESVCAIQSEHVESILLLEQPVTGLPDSTGTVLGMIQHRGSALPLLALRQLLGLTSQDADQAEFEAMLDQRKQDHLHWVEELTRCLADGTPFHLATDPHKCAFGRWYYSYQPVSQSVAFQLGKIEEPHAKLHHTALDAFACQRHCESCGREICLQTSLKQGLEVYMPQVLTLLEEAKQAFRASYRKMVVVLSDGHRSRGLLVDEVLAVESVRLIKPLHDRGPDGQPSLVTGVVQRSDSQDLILMLDHHLLLASHDGL